MNAIKLKMINDFYYTFAKVIIKFFYLKIIPYYNFRYLLFFCGKKAKKFQRIQFTFNNYQVNNRSFKLLTKKC